jgi:hypothetical protein
MNSESYKAVEEIFEDYLSKAIDLIVGWIGSAIYPPPEIVKRFSFNLETEEFCVELGVPNLVIGKDDLEILNQDRGGVTPRHRDIRTAKLYIQTIRGDLKIHSAFGRGTIFNINIRRDDPFQKLREVNQELWGLLHPWQALKLAFFRRPQENVS